MLNKYNTYITKQHINTMNYDTVYDGKQKYYHTTLDNKDLVNILNFQSVNSPLDKRIQQDFLKVTHTFNPLRGKKTIIPMNIGKTSTDLYSHLKKKSNKTNNRKKRKYHVTHKKYKKSKKTISIRDLL